LCLVSCVLIFSGCDFLNDKTYSPTEAEQKLVDFCKKEGSIDITARQLGRTEWLYLALPEPIFDVKANASAENAERKVMPFSLLSLSGEFDNRIFSVDYDIVPEVLSPEAVSYGSAYNETYTKKRQLIYQGIQETFFNLSKDEETKAAAPIFFVVVIADANKGIATKSIFYLPDLKAFLTEAIPFEEYYLRELSSIFGDENLIGDKTGKALKTNEITWGYFLTEQIQNRVRFRFTHSDFKPKADPDKEIVSIAANTLRLYPFEYYDTVYLFNRREKREMRFSKEQMKTFEEEPAWKKDKGRVTVIKFRIPKPPNEESLPTQEQTE